MLRSRSPYARLFGGLFFVALSGVAPRARADNVIETVEFVVELGTSCETYGYGVWVSNVYTGVYPCNNGLPYAALTPQQLDAYTGIPAFADNPITYYPHWRCVPPPVPGPFIFDTCNTSPEPDASSGGTCSNEGPGDPQGSLGDPVDITTGLLAQTPTDLDLGHGLRFARQYTSAKAPTIGSMGRGWEHSLQWSLQRQTSAGLRVPVLFVYPPFHAPVAFIKKSATDTSYVASQRGDGTLTVDADGTAHYTAADGTVAVFSPSNQLLSLQPVGERLINVTYTTNTTTFSNGPQTIVVTTSSSKVSAVTGGGQNWTYTYDGYQNLKTVTGPDPTSSSGGTLTWTYGYTGIGSTSSGYLTSVTRSDIGTLASWSYGLPSPFQTYVRTADEPALDQALTFST